MAHSSKLVSWLTENASALNLQVTELSWPREWMLALSDLEVSIEVEGRTFRGRGTDAEEELAFVKAGAEAIERAFCAGHGIHSVGVAAHTEEIAARFGAERELFERDAFFSHFLTRTAFSPVKPDAPVVAKFAGVFSAATDASIRIRFFRARCSYQAVVVAVAEGARARPSFGGLVGLGCAPTEDAAMQSALVECARNVAAILLAEGREPMSLEQFAKIPGPTSEDRQRLALDQSYWNKVAHLFPETPSELSSDGASVVQPLFERLSSPFRAFETAPLVVYRAQFVNVGALNGRNPSTLARLSEFKGKVLTEAHLESLPDFLG